MKNKFMSLLLLALPGSLLFSQFTSGVVNLPTASMTVKLDVNATTATLTLTGDSNSMLGIGFGSDGMNTGDDGFIYNSTANRDYTFNGAGTAPLADASQDWTVGTNTVSGSTRTIVATRSLAGGSGDFAFSNTAGSINIYYARRNGNQNLGYHSSLRDYATLNMTASLGVGDTNVQSQNVKIYPNPANEVLQFKNAQKLKEFAIYDANGKLVLQSKNSVESININKLESGVYFVEMILMDGNKSYEKMIKK